MVSIATEETDRDCRQKLLDLQLSEDEWIQLHTLLDLLIVCPLLIALIAYADFG